MTQLYEHPTFTGYFADTEGNIYSNQRSKDGKPKPLANRDNGNGYRIIRVKKFGGKYMNYYAHRLVYEAVNQQIIKWGSHEPNGLTINHINGIRSDNRISNMEILTKRENIQKAYPKERNGMIKGVYFDTSNRKYFVRICIGRNIKTFLRTEDLEEANNMARKIYQQYFGETI